MQSAWNTYTVAICHWATKRATHPSIMSPHRISQSGNPACLGCCMSSREYCKTTYIKSHEYDYVSSISFSMSMWCIKTSLSVLFYWFWNRASLTARRYYKAVHRGHIHLKRERAKVQCAFFCRSQQYITVLRCIFSRFTTYPRLKITPK